MGLLKINSSSRLTQVLTLLSINERRWYRVGKENPRAKPGPKPGKVTDHDVVIAILAIALANPWYGYKRIAVISRREGWQVSNRRVYKILKSRRLLKKKKATQAELYQSRKLFELLPQGVNELWQTDVTYIHIPGYGWWYAVTVIDYYSRYLLACYFTPHYRAVDCVTALQEAKNEAERIHGKLIKPVILVTDNGSSFLAKRFSQFLASDDFKHVRIQYRTPTQLGLLERFHQTLKQEEVYWHIYKNPAHARESLAEFRDRYNIYRPHWALVPEQGGDPVTPYDVYAKGVKTQIPKWQGWAKAAKKKLEEQMLISDEVIAKTGT